MANSGERPSTTARRTTINLTRRGDAAVASLKGHLGTTNETDAINRGLDFAAQVLDMLKNGGTLKAADGKEVKLLVL
jgi:hypothetical protein